jgi:E1A-binding protein p400
MNDGNDADDDADMSDVDDFASLADSVGSNASNGSDEFASNPLDCVDDESTLDAEMRLKPDISAQEELALLQREADMSVEELQAMYAGASGAGDQNDDKNDINANRNADSNMGSASSSSEDFEDDGQAVDDERTIAAEELLGRDMPYDDEIALLQRENEMSIEELKAMYHNVQADSGDDDVDPKESAEEDIGSVTSDSQDEGEFEPATGADIDDETTIDAEERLGREITHQEEIDMLQKESEMPIEQLRAMYANQDAGMAENDDDESMSPHDSLDQTYATSESKKRKLELETGKVEDEEEDEGAAAIKSLEYADEKARNTAVSRPYLIPSWVKLRKYQHVGLNWLVSIQTRRLNGILADEMVSHRSLFFEAFLTLVCLSNFRLRRSPGSW